MFDRHSEINKVYCRAGQRAIAIAEFWNLFRDRKYRAGIRNLTAILFLNPRQQP